MIHKITTALVAASFALFLTGCDPNTQIVPVKTNAPITIPAFLLNDAACPQIKQFPDYRNYTERQVADLLLKLVQSNRMCYNTLQKIKTYLEQHNKIVASK